MWQETTGDGWDYNEATHTLTLNNLTGTYLYFMTNQENQKLKIVLKGTNTLKSLTVEGYDLIISGKGKLNLTGRQESSETLYCYRHITVDEGTLNISPREYKSDYEGEQSCAIFTYDGITVNAGSVNINLPVVKGNRVIGKAGHYWAEVEKGIWTHGNVVINGGSVNIKVPDSKNKNRAYSDINCAKLILKEGKFSSDLLFDSYYNKVDNGIKTVKGGKWIYVGEFAGGVRITGTGLVTLAGRTYALVKSVVKTGKVQTVTIGGKTYVVNKSGVVQKAKSGKKVVNVSKKSYIVNTSGVVQKSGSAKYKLIKAGKKYYIVNKSGLVQKNKKSIKIGKYVYKTSKTGVATRKK